MKIVHIIVGLNIGGAELMLKRLIKAHHGSQEYRHSVVSLTSIGTVGLQLIDLGYEVEALGMRSWVDLPRIMYRMVRLIHKGKFDVVQTWMYHADLLGGIAAWIAGNRNVVWGIRATEVAARCSRVTALVRQVCALLSSYVPKVIVCAANASRLAHIAVGYDASRIVVVPNGFDLDRLNATPADRTAMRANCGFDDSVDVVGYLGRFHIDKDQENFVRAAGLVAEKSDNVRFLMVGRDLVGSNAQLSDWINATGFSDRFVLLGERSDAHICLAAMDIFCLSSRTEGFPNVAAEAMAMGVPCVVTDVGDAAMLVAGTGVIVPKEDSRALAHGVRRLLTMSSDVRKHLGKEARARIRANFTIDCARDRFELIYQQVTKAGVN